MIASFSRGFVFIKGRKTAGTSIEIALSRFCGEGDVITPVSQADEIVRCEQGGRPPQNYGGEGSEAERFRMLASAADIAQVKRAGRAAPRSRTFYNHMPASAAAKALPEGFWRRAFKFTVDRHPYEKAVSLAYFGYARAKRKYPGCSFEDWLDRVVRLGKYRNFDLYAGDGRLTVDVVLRYEDMPGCLSVLMKYTGIDIAPVLPRTKHRFRTDRRPAAETLSDRQKALIQTVCGDEFELLRYPR